ncbi:MAG TPA: KTSC domain-containing protein [Verrucomicrobiales bacterium]|jgi:lysyl-tRNA synthetase class 2|nr:KTSC domain-containing protein [Verrucomicrobiales bacterium]
MKTPDSPWNESPGSTTMRRFRYQRSKLDIEFVKGDIYQYRAVPRSIYTGLCEAESKGKYFNEHILDKFAFVRR